jgi:hypothetical protein
MKVMTCPVIRRVWELYPEEQKPRSQKLVILFEKHHNHPAIPERKPNARAKNATHSIVKRAGDVGISAGGVIQGILL